MLWLSLATVLSVLGVVSLAGVVWFHLPPNLFAKANSANLGHGVVRLSGPLPTNSVILYLTLAIAFWAYLELDSNPRRRRVARWTLPVLCVAAGLTLSRGILGFFVALVGLAFSGQLRPRIPAVGRLGLLVLTALLAGGVLMTTVWAVFPLQRDDARPLGLSVNRSPNAYALLDVAALRMWRSAPLLGVGPGEYGSRLGDFSSTTERLATWPPLGLHRVWGPHSTWLGLAAETGTLGLSVWVVLLGTIARRLSRAVRTGSTSAEFAGPTLMGIAVSACFVSLEHLKFIWAFVGIALAAAHGDRDGQQEPAHTPLTAFRLPPELLTRIDAYAERLRAEVPWSNATRADSARALLTYALDRLEAEGKVRRGR